jgi:hydroxypyruvate reductase
MEGEARAVGCAHAEQLLDADAGTAWVWGGEPTVHVTGSGTGGRNQEAALAAVQTLAQSDTPVVLFCAGTDGIDGPTDAAGAWATSATFADARSRGADPDAYLAENDSYPFFKQVDGLYQPGSTGTNVMDLHIGLKAD